jgi:hypothetical protein
MAPMQHRALLDERTGQAAILLLIALAAALAFLGGMLAYTIRSANAIRQEAATMKAQVEAYGALQLGEWCMSRQGLCAAQSGVCVASGSPTEPRTWISVRQNEYGRVIQSYASLQRGALFPAYQYTYVLQEGQPMLSQGLTLQGISPTDKTPPCIPP